MMKMSLLKQLIFENYKFLNTVKQSDNGTVQQVLGCDGNIYIRKTLIGIFLPSNELMALAHPYIVKTVQAVTDDAGSYVIEEYAEGKTLAAYMETGKSFSENEVIKIAEQMCDALTCLEEHKLVHRDIKPSNILLQASGAIKLIDFGACRNFAANEEKSRDTVVLGTQGYAAPEQFGGKPTDYKADIYSLGVTMKELLGDRYHGKLGNIISGCLEFDPINRPDAIELKKQLLSVKSASGKWFKYATIPAVILLFALAGFIYYRQQAQVLPQVKNNVITIEQKQEVSSTDKKAVNSKVKIELEPRNWVFTYDIRDFPYQKLSGAKSIRIADYTHQPEIIIYTGKKELQNMRATYVFRDIKFWGDDSTIGPNAVGNIYRWQVFKDEEGNSNKVVHRISGGIIDSVAPYFTLSLSNIGMWFLTGDNPSLSVTVEADNAEPTTINIPISIK